MYMEQLIFYVFQGVLREGGITVTIFIAERFLLAASLLVATISGTNAPDEKNFPLIFNSGKIMN
jgi:hypothetical protein